MKRNCDICSKKNKSTPAIADVKLNLLYGGKWAYVCLVHYSLRSNNTNITLLRNVDDES